MTQFDLSEYDAFLKNDFNSSELANKLLLETNNIHDSTLELETSIKKLGFDLNDINSKIEENVKVNSRTLIDEFDQVEILKEQKDLIKPSINQLSISFDRLDNEIIKPYNECTNLQMALKKIYQTNKLLRFLTFIVHLLNKIEEIDKSENNLSTKPFKNLYDLSVLLNEFNSLSNNPSFNLIKLIRDYIQFSKILIKRCETIIQYQIKNLLKFPIQEYITSSNTNNNFSTNNNNIFVEKSLFNLLSSSMLLNNSNFLSNIELLYTATSKHSINLILRNLNNTKYLPLYIKSLEKPAILVQQLENFMKSTKWIDSNKLLEFTDITVWDYLRSNDLFKLFDADEMKSIGLIDKFWRDIALSVDLNIKEVVNRGGPIVKNLKSIKKKLENEIKNVVMNSYNDKNSQSKTEKLEIRMMLNSITNFEKRK
jgi:hypothetical protein